MHASSGEAAEPPPIIGPDLAALRAELPGLARSPEHVIIVGEEGVGKSLFAWHFCWPAFRSGRSCRSLNCLTSSQRDQRLSLCGAEYTSLSSTRRGLLEHQANVIVKHVDRAPLGLQEQLGRSLAEGKVKRWGASAGVELRARLILTFRESPESLLGGSVVAPALAEALQRLPVLRIPPLRERHRDCLAIAGDFLGHPVSARLRRALLGYGWPGNVAELKAYLAISSPRPLAGSVEPDLCRWVARAMIQIEGGSEISLTDSVELVRRGLVRHALLHARGDRGSAARLLGVTERTLRWHISHLR
jgi:anaerobic nitric oxide reductase transcription regulator